VSIRARRISDLVCGHGWFGPFDLKQNQALLVLQYKDPAAR
jgi:hypothetical protein